MFNSINRRFTNDQNKFTELMILFQNDNIGLSYYYHYSKSSCPKFCMHDVFSNCLPVVLINFFLYWLLISDWDQDFQTNMKSVLENLLLEFLRFPLFSWQEYRKSCSLAISLILPWEFEFEFLINKCKKEKKRKFKLDFRFRIKIRFNFMYVKVFVKEIELDSESHIDLTIIVKSRIICTLIHDSQNFSRCLCFRVLGFRVIGFWGWFHLHLQNWMEC